jgi:hypothetical protein
MVCKILVQVIGSGLDATINNSEADKMLSTSNSYLKHNGLPPIKIQIWE